MQRLTHENFTKAKNYIFANSNDINRAWFRYHFEDSNTNTFMDVLAQYQHESGGFGGLSNEFEYQGPCLKCTEHAIEYITGLKEKPSDSHPVIQKMMVYILEQYIPGIGNWGEVIPPEVNDYLHCHWSRYRGELITPTADEDERIKNYDANEKVCFAAFVALYPKLVSDKLYQEIIKYPTENILRYWDVNSPQYRKEIFDDGTPYAFEYFLWFVPCLKDKVLADKLTSILRQNPTVFWEHDFTKSNSDYVHLPCDYAVCSPDCIVYPVVKDLIDESLSYKIKQQTDDGKWSLGWSYGESEGLQKLQMSAEVTGTVNMLVKLKRFGRVDL